MSHPPPPGLHSSQPSSSTSASTAHPHPSLPARPPAPTGPLSSFKVAFTSNGGPSSGPPGTRGYGNENGRGQGPSGFGAFTGFKPRSVAVGSQDWRSHSSTVSALPVTAPGYSQLQTGYGRDSLQQNAYGGQQGYYPQPGTESFADPTPPQIRNPFPLPGQDRGLGRGTGLGEGAYDPEMEAQIAQWQSAYAGRDDTASGRADGRTRGNGPMSAGGANAIPLGVRANMSAQMSSVDVASAVNADKGVAAVVAGADGKQKTVVRSGGGQTWQDPSLLEWDPAHFRLFVGNLAGEVTDDSLLKAFSRYSSVQKARVVRDKRTTKSKGYGFVSFSNGDDYFQAAKDMQGKYIGSHPVLIKRSTTEIRPTVPMNKKKNAKAGKGGSGVGRANTGAGVQKRQSKTKGGLKILG